MPASFGTVIIYKVAHKVRSCLPVREVFAILGVAIAVTYFFHLFHLRMKL